MRDCQFCVPLQICCASVTSFLDAAHHFPTGVLSRSQGQIQGSGEMQTQKDPDTWELGCAIHIWVL